MQKFPESALLRYSGAIIAIFLSTAVRLMLDPFLGNLFPVATHFLAVLVVAGYAGRGPALLATGLGALTSAYFIVPPRLTLWVEGIENQSGLLLYLLVGGGIALLGGALRSARQKAEAEAHEAVRQREQLRITLDSVGDAVVVTDADSRVMSLNPVAEALTGWSSAEALGQPLPSVFRIVNEGNRRPVDNPALRALHDGVIVGLANHTLLIARDGSERPIDDSAAPIRDSTGRVVGAILVFRDITERKQAHRALIESEARYRTIFNSMDEGFCVIEMIFDVAGRPVDYRFLKTNPAFEKHTGLSDAAGKRMRELAPEHEAHWFEIYGKIAMTGERARFANVAIALEGRWFDVYAFRLGGTESRKVAIFFSDITERRRNEESLKEADRRKEEFLATLAHELRNPLAPIRNGLEIMRLAGDNREAAEEARTLIERQVVHMVRLIDDLMDISRISRDKLELRREHVELAAVVQNALDTSRPLVEVAGHQLTVTLPADRPIYVDADVTRLSQVFSNLLNNAAKYTERGGDISLAVEYQGSDVVVSVRDNGVGIPPEMLPHIFDMFTQIDRSLERAQGGLGIGLSLVRRLIEMHGGSVEARSAGHGLGSEFVVRLPVIVSSPTKQTTPEDGAASAITTAGRRILVVDDNNVSARTLARLLTMLGHEARIAHDGGEAVTAAEQYRPDLMLLDIGLPVMNGYDVARTIRGQPWGRDIVIVALTGWGQEEDRRRSEEAGMDHHLVKPVDPVALEKLLIELRARKTHL
jgi:PAS domain S-box-containing protein